MKEFEIYFSDLTEDAQKEFLKFMKIDSASDGNYDVFPIATVYNEQDTTDVFDK